MHAHHCVRMRMVPRASCMLFGITSCNRRRVLPVCLSSRSCIMHAHHCVLMHIGRVHRGIFCGLPHDIVTVSCQYFFGSMTCIFMRIIVFRCEWCREHRWMLSLYAAVPHDTWQCVRYYVSGGVTCIMHAHLCVQRCMLIQALWYAIWHCHLR
jgi:hypothetical protein